MELKIRNLIQHYTDQLDRLEEELGETDPEPFEEGQIVAWYTIVHDLNSLLGDTA